MHDQVRKPDELTVLLGRESVYRRARVAQCCPRLLGDLRRECGAVERQIAVPQRLPGPPVVGPYRSDDHFVMIATCLPAHECRGDARFALAICFMIMPVIAPS
jgi:hypothetical protein